jgi:hypothetical protein
MASTGGGQDIGDFFDSYRRAFERFDTPTISEHFAFPLHITADSDEINVTSIPDEAAWIRQLERLLGMYRAIGVTSAQVIRVDVTQISPRLCHATVRWVLNDAAGTELYDFEAAYTLARFGDALKITAIAHNEIPRYRKCLARVREADSR